MSGAMSPSGPRLTPKVARWRYVVPNAITCIGLLIGVTACFRAMEGQHIEAAWLIILCVLLDKLDGTAARVLGATSRIGVQLDSFSDFVTFGLAPATLTYMTIWQGSFEGSSVAAFSMWDGETAQWGLRMLVGSYILCAVIRLAKFNVLTAADADGVFYGYPTTSSGAMMALLLLLLHKHGQVEMITWIPVIAAMLGGLMVSNLPLPKVGSSKTKAIVVLQGMCMVGAYVCGIARIYPEFLMALLLAFSVIGFAWGFVHREELAPTRLDPYPD
jgi:CDP-diacylglycerol--serine O-phosphatidyltransferase